MESKKLENLSSEDIKKKFNSIFSEIRSNAHTILVDTIPKKIFYLSELLTNNPLFQKDYLLKLDTKKEFFDFIVFPKKIKNPRASPVYWEDIGSNIITDADDKITDFTFTRKKMKLDHISSSPVVGTNINISDVPISESKAVPKNTTTSYSNKLILKQLSFVLPTNYKPNSADIEIMVKNNHDTNTKIVNTNMPDNKSVNYDIINNTSNSNISIILPDSLEILSTLKQWLHLLQTPINTGCDMITVTTDEIISYINRIEEIIIYFIENSLIKYFATRGKLVSKVLKWDSIQDYQYCIIELDLKQSFTIIDFVTEIRNGMVVLLDMFNKNYHKLVRDGD